MDEKPIKTDGQYALDIIAGSNDRDKERLVKIIIVLIIAWALTIGGFLLYLNQYDFTALDVQQDGHGLNIIGDRNGVRSFYGAVGETSGADAQNVNENQEDSVP